MNIFQRWKQTTIANKGLVLSSALVAFGTLFYAGAAIVQVCIMQNSAKDNSIQTEKLIKAGQDQAEAAGSFSVTADRINANIQAAEKNLQKMADQAVASNENNRSAVEAVQRAFIVFVNHGTDFFNYPEQGVDVPYVKVRAVWANTGATSAPVAVQNFRFTSFGSREPYAHEFLEQMDYPPIAGVIGPKVEWDSVSRSVREDRLYPMRGNPPRKAFDRNSWIGFGFVAYRDVFGHPHITETCQSLVEDLATKPTRTFLWQQCPDFTCVDKYCANYQELEALLPPEKK